MTWNNSSPKSLLEITLRCIYRQSHIIRLELEIQALDLILVSKSTFRGCAVLVVYPRIDACRKPRNTKMIASVASSGLTLLHTIPSTYSSILQSRPHVPEPNNTLTASIRAIMSKLCSSVVLNKYPAYHDVLLPGQGAQHMHQT